MSVLGMVLFGLLLAVRPAGGDSRTTGKAEVQRFRDATWSEVRRLADIDRDVLRDLQERFGKGSAFADVGGPFDATDVRTGKPTRRLVVAGRAGERWFICYEHGGRGYHLVLVVYDTTARARPVLLARGGAGNPDHSRGWHLGVEDLRRALRSGELEVERRMIPDSF
jgi:hypothetical protein